MISTNNILLERKKKKKKTLNIKINFESKGYLIIQLNY